MSNVRTTLNHGIHSQLIVFAAKAAAIGTAFSALTNVHVGFGGIGICLALLSLVLVGSAIVDAAK